MDTAEVQRRMNQLDSDVRETLMIVHDIEDTQSTHGQQLARIHVALDEHNQEFVRIHGVLDEHSQEFVRIHGVLDEHSQEFVRIHGVLDEHGGVLNEHTQQLERINSVLDEHGRALQTLEVKFDGMDAKLETVIGLLEDHGPADGS